MRDDRKNKAELLKEVERLRKRVAKLRQIEEALRESEERYEALFQGAADGIVVADIETMEFKYVNPAICNMLGYTEEELKQLGVRDIHPKEDLQHVISEFKAQAQGEKTLSTSLPCLRKDGTIIYADVNTAKVLINGKQCNVGFFTDITDRKRAEDVLRESEKRFREIFENIAVGVYRTTPEGQILMANPALVQMLGYSSFEELSQRNLEEEGFEPKYERSTFKEKIEREGRIVSSESTWITRDGKTLYVIENARVVRDEDGNTLYYEGTAENITERRRADEEIKKFKEMAERATYGCVMSDLNGNLTYINDSFARMHGYSPAELIGKNLKIFHTDAQMEHVGKLIKQLMETGEGIKSEEFWHVHRDGTEFPTLMSNWGLKDRDGNIQLLCATAIDITKHRQAEQKVRESEEKYRGLTESLNELVYRADPETFVATYVNNAVERFYGCNVEEWLSDPYLWENSIHPDDRERTLREFEEAKRQLKSAIVEYRIINRHKEVRWVEDHVSWERDQEGKAISMNGVMYDITERKKAEDELNEYRDKMARAERLASLGTLSATVAHKLNTPLTAIRLSIENSLAKLETMSCPSTVIEDLKDGLSGVSDVASIAAGFHKFARKSSEEIIREVDLKTVAERILKLLSESARRAKVSLHSKGMDELPTIYSNEKDLEQLFFALVENSIQAADGKRNHQFIISGAVKNKHIELRFADNCGGIAAENLDKIFEPFFTTRSAREGTGLGLCVVEHIVSRAGGKVRVASIAGEGTTFLVTLPINKGRRS